MKNPCPRIEGILPQSLAEKYNILPDEILRRINGKVLRDIIDYQYLTADEDILLEVESAKGEVRQISLQKDFDDDLGIVFRNAVFDGIKSCRNHCVFCFVDQMPKGYRKTLYVKDDDYRLSFLYGNYITLTNLKEEDYQRIEDDHLSPLFISIHCVDAEVRKTLLGIEENPPIMEKLRRLADSGIEMHGQIVVAPTLNDGEILENTITEIASLGDAFLSLALVPVGLTKCQKNDLRIFTQEEAAAVIKTAEAWQKTFLEQRGSRFLYPSDELYLLAEMDVPSEDYYEDYPQIENGVGIIRRFYTDFSDAAAMLSPLPWQGKKAVLITGADGEKALKPRIKELRELGADVETLRINNYFFGDTVTVTGLLTGEDIINTVKQNKEKNVIYLLPDVLLKHHSDVLLDGKSVADLEKETDAVFWVVPTDGASLIDVLWHIGKDITL